MRSTAGPLPSSLSAPRFSPRFWIAIAAGLSAGVCGYAGLYPRFDDGNLRVVIGLTSIPFAAAVVATSLGARTPARAFGLAVLLSSILGVASTIVPAALLSNGKSDHFVMACMFGAFFGAPTGACYGLPLAVLAACGHRHMRSATHEATDHAARVGGVGLFLAGLLGLLTTLAFDAHADLPALVAVVASIAGLAVSLRSLARQRQRSTWIDRVRTGLEPAFRLRPVDLRDRVEGLPRLSNGSGSHEVTVVEWLPGEISSYRANAAGTAIAIVSAEPPIVI